MKIGVSVEYVFKYIFVAVYKLDHIYIYIYDCRYGVVPGEDRTDL